MIRLWPETAEPGVCQGCGDPILWYRTRAGAAMPMQQDAAPAWIEHDLLDGELAVFDAKASHWPHCAAIERLTRRRSVRR